MYWSLLVAIGCAALVGWRVWSYPGGWGRTFAGSHAGERRELAAARQAVRRRQWAARREISGAQMKLRSRTAAYQQRIRSARRRLERLNNPGRGEVVARLGEAVLHEHVVAFEAEALPLAGLGVRCEHSNGKSHLYLTRPNGRVRHEVYPHDEHDEDDVRRFAVQVQNAAADEEDFRLQHTALVEEAEAELEAARADTTAQEEAREHLALVTERHRRDAGLKTALAELESARERWRQASGRRPR